MLHRRRDVPGGLGVSLGLRVGGPLLGEAAPPDPTIIFVWSPINGQSLPSGTFTRASVKEEFDGTDFTELASGTIPENSASVGGGAKGFHPEPAATNQMTESTNFGSGTWTENQITATDQGLGALGLNEYELDVGTLNNVHRIFATAAAGAAGTGYMLIKGDDTNSVEFVSLQRGSGNNDYATFNVTSPAVTDTGSAVDDASVTLFGQGYFKAQIVGSSAGTLFNIIPTDTGTPGSPATAPNTFLGNNELLFVDHAQYEHTSFGTSPIKTAGGTAAREADVLDTDVTIASEFSALLDVTLPEIIGTGNTITLLGPDATAEDILRVEENGDVVMDDGGTPVTIGTATLGTRIRVAYGRDAAGRSGSLDGATAVTGGAPGAGHVGDSFQLGSANSVNQSRSIHHVSILYDVKKSDAELEALSS